MTAGSVLRASVGDLEVAYAQAGSGQPVVLVHGLAEDHHSWAPQQEALTGCETFAYDLRGHGQTDLGAPQGTLEQLAGDLAGFLEGVSGPATCVGFSLGGTIVLRAAATRPELVRRAIVLGTSSVVGRRAADFYRDRIGTVRSGDAAAFTAALSDDTAAAIARPDVDLDRVVGQRLEAVGAGAGYVNAATAMAGLAEEPLTPLLEQVRCRVDVVGGEHDAFCPRKAADIMLAALPNAVYREIPGVGHLMNVDDPEAVTRTLREALAEEGAP